MMCRPPLAISKPALGPVDAAASADTNRTSCSASASLGAIASTVSEGMGASGLGPAGAALSTRVTGPTAAALKL